MKQFHDSSSHFWPPNLTTIQHPNKTTIVFDVSHVEANIRAASCAQDYQRNTSTANLGRNEVATLGTSNEIGDDDRHEDSFALVAA